MKKTLVTGLTAFGMIFLTGCGQQQAGQTQLTTPAPATAQQLAKPTLQPTDESTNWKTYNNATYGYSIKYPTDLILTEFNKTNGNAQLVQQKINLKNKDLSISVFVWNKGASPSNDPETIQNYQKVIVDGHEALRGRDYGNGYFEETYINNGDYTFQIEYAAESDAGLAIYDKIISFFKFTK